MPGIALNEFFTGKSLFLQLDPYKRSIFRMQQKLLYNVFKTSTFKPVQMITLTVADDGKRWYRDKSSGESLLVCGNYTKFKESPGVFLRKFMNRLKTIAKRGLQFAGFEPFSFNYFSRLERGEKYGRFHFHILVDVPIDKFLINYCWRNGRGRFNLPLGYSKLDDLSSDEKVLAYVLKYTSKSTKGEYFEMFNRCLPSKTRRFTSCRAIKLMPKHVSLKKILDEKHRVIDFEINPKNAIEGSGFFMLNEPKYSYDAELSAVFNNFSDEIQQDMSGFINQEEVNLAELRYDKRIHRESYDRLVQVYKERWRFFHSRKKISTEELLSSWHFRKIDVGLIQSPPKVNNLKIIVGNSLFIVRRKKKIVIKKRKIQIPKKPVHKKVSVPYKIQTIIKDENSWFESINVKMTPTSV